MAAGANRRKLQETTITIASTSSSGNTAESAAIASHEHVLFVINITTATAGTITFVIQTSADDGTTWSSLSSGEMLGDTGAISTTGGKHISARAPLGVRLRLNYTIATGPFAFTVLPIYERTGATH